MICFYRFEFNTGFVDPSGSDIVTIYDGATTSDPVIIRTALSNVTLATFANSSVLLITFVSDGSYRTGNGFQVNYVRLFQNPTFSYNDGDITNWNVKVPYGATPTIDGSGVMTLLQGEDVGVPSSAALSHMFVS